MLLLALAQPRLLNPVGEDDGEQPGEEGRKGEHEDGDPLHDAQETRVLDHHPAEDQRPQKIDGAAHGGGTAQLQPAHHAAPEIGPVQDALSLVIMTIE